MADDEDIAALVVDNGSGMCKGKKELNTIVLCRLCCWIDAVAGVVWWLPGMVQMRTNCVTFLLRSVPMEMFVIYFCIIPKITNLTLGSYSASCRLYGIANFRAQIGWNALELRTDEKTSWAVLVPWMHESHSLEHHLPKNYLPKQCNGTYTTIIR